tara:strand:- start:4600 stop:5289 length:690 start_codon:yes stop_codon:yes gene_type:complete
VSKENEGNHDVMNTIHKMRNQFQKSQEQHEKNHEALKNNNELLIKFYTDKSKLDTWLALDEAIPFCVGSSKESWPTVKKQYDFWANDVRTQIKASAGISLKILNPEAKERLWRVKPTDFVDWLINKELCPNEHLKTTFHITKQQKAKEIISNHGNAERFAQQREQILAAALSALANFPDQCKSQGKVNGAAIAKVMEQKSQLWFGNDELPLSTRGIANLINKSLKMKDD